MPIPQYFDSRPYQDIQDADMLGIGDLVFDDGSRKFVNGDPEIAATFPPLPDAPDMGATDTGLPPGIKINLDGTIENGGGADVAPTFKPQNSMALEMPEPEPPPPPPRHEPMGITAVGANQGTSVGGMTPQNTPQSPAPEPMGGLPPDIGISMDGRIVPKGSPDDGMIAMQREGAMPADLAQQQASELGSAQQNTFNAAQQARDDEARIMREATLKRQGELEAERKAREEALQEDQSKQERLRKEEEDVANTDIKTDLASAKGEFGGFLMVIGAALLGANGSDAGLRAIDSTIDRHVRKQVSQRDTKLNMLAKQLGSTEQAIAAGKAELYRIGGEKAANLVDLTKADVFEKQTPAVLAAMSQKHTEEMHKFQQLSLGKTIEKRPDPVVVPPAQVQKYGEAAASQQASQNDAQRALRAIGGVYDPKTGRITNRDEILKKGIPGVGGFDSFMKDLGKIPVVGSLPTAVDNAITSKEGLRIRSALQGLVTAQAVADNPGRAPTDADMTAARDKLGLNTEAGTVDAIERLLNDMPRQKAGNVSTFGPAAADVYNQRQQQQGINPSTNASPGSPTMLEPGRAREQLREQPQSRKGTFPDKMPEPYNNAVPPGPMGEVAGEVQKLAGQELPPKAVAILTAQAAHETNDGKSAPNNNYWGHKSTGRSEGADLMTTEGKGADAKRVRQSFAKYATVEEATADHIRLLQSKYPDAWAALQAEDEAAFVEALAAGGYFTGDPTAYLKGIQRRL